MQGFLPGDIILLRRHKHSWITWILMTIVQIFRFFIMKIGLIDVVDRFYHVEMSYGHALVFSEEPPRARVMPIQENAKFKVYRLKNKPANFEDSFFTYCSDMCGTPFDYVKFWQKMLDGIFKTLRFSKGHIRSQGDICAEDVTRFYAERVGIPCSMNSPESSLPSHINQYCSNHPEIFELIVDET